MFDADTAKLIASATPLPGLNLEDLPQQLTEAYTKLVSTRIRLRAIEQGALPADIEKIVSDTRRLAFAHEAFVSSFLERDNRAASAFVAGTAHHICLLAERMRSASTRPSRLGLQAISPEISAAILFMISESSADAAEMAKSIVVATGDAVERALLTTIRYLVSGRLRSILAAPLPSQEDILAGNHDTHPVRALYHEILLGVRSLAARTLGEDDRTSVGNDPRTAFVRVKELSVEELGDIADTGATSYSLYPGPLHLASLLEAASTDLLSAAVVNIPAPPGVDGGRWFSTMQSIAERRPYLWRNHTEAIQTGYLTPGTSSVISFPTGAGKSTLAELKIATALLRGVKTVFLAPTLALVDQTARALQSTFPNADVMRELQDALLFDLEDETLHAISVMTPERCLALLSFDGSIFANVGLLVFDECHLLHPRDQDTSRRAIDAMLCVLSIVAAAPQIDLLLLSAMMMNAKEISAWIQELTGRHCLPLELTWKPTRQVRGCVVYRHSELNILNERLRQVRAQVKNKDAPAALKRDLSVLPFGFFCLRQTWQSREIRDYALVQLLDKNVVLSTGTRSNANKDWYLTPNGNQVAAVIAESTASQGLKTLIFVQTIPLANSATRDLTKRLARPSCTLTPDEAGLLEVSIDECGGRDYVFVEADPNGRLASPATCHHGLLLAQERHLHESLFRRPDGVHVLVATSTLAQGMNLPSEVVIIAGDSRFDSSANRMERLEAHELLNAAGRAGRAGDNSYGFVLVIPSKVVHFNSEANQIHSHWAELQAIFSQSDQCLTIDDPLGSLLDEIHSAAAPLSDLATYFVRRLPVDIASDPDGRDVSARALLARSFAGFRARSRNDQAWTDTRVEAAVRLRRTDPDNSETPTWVDRLAATIGVPVAIVRELGGQLSGQIRGDATVVQWCEWMITWLSERPHILPILIRRESMEGLLGTPYKALEDDRRRGELAVPTVFPLLRRWMAGDSLADLERSVGTREDRLGKCDTGREFVLRMVPELAYIFGLPRQIRQEMTAEQGSLEETPLALQVLDSCIREGFDSTEKFAARHYHGGKLNRRKVHREFARIQAHLAPPAPGEELSGAIRRIEHATLMADLFA
jgi:superfamily II DNA/RNA helicase